MDRDSLIYAEAWVRGFEVAQREPKMRYAERAVQIADDWQYMQRHIMTKKQEKPDGDR